MVIIKMSVLENSGDRLVLKTSQHKWGWGVFSVVVGVVCLTISLATGWLADAGIMRGIWIFIGALGLLVGLHVLVNSKTFTADRQRQEVEMRNHYFGLWTRSSKVSFSEVESVNLEYHESRGGSPSLQSSDPFWIIYLPCKNFKPVEVSRGENEQEQLEIASALSAILDKKVKRTEAGPGFFDRLFTSAQEDQDRRKPPSTWTDF